MGCVECVSGYARCVNCGCVEVNYGVRRVCELWVCRGVNYGCVECVIMGCVECMNCGV